uniref:Uncharacterized protein n=1 Tax=Haptolina brevifila TaxID=156173 RepID=A0A7S2DTS7_9EUKA|mmetsp:Transcript_43606/g.87261  ORF Transcript_43606/g.87261 Transcript_43606/m.87261 type:complete len:160 (+) Transcript_43606:190-669(+)|eukprot:CAMPEP_0174717312 /NCGR_PEP_ID=MMETSP1094-20130205/26363_1 /TAXON_ID=156173 /ORGANISM="Chrysochromulina brevifilum, Strain UTEX LB 985" /LENGTH=159 /DNA_ID=CAMNT_0015917225 /DNA_START=189 /DNA_END=668 /DNA_ORIENTATION=-
MNYSKWDSIDADDDKSSVSVPPAPPAPATSAKGPGIDALQHMDALKHLRADSSIDELKNAMKNLPTDAKHKFMTEMSKPGMLEQVTQMMSALKADDPAQAAKAMVGMQVKIKGLQAKPELNGRTGQVVEFLEDKGRCAVQLDGETAKILVKPDNLDSSR